nr:unnamed protein product [Digitaria exilis]
MAETIISALIGDAVSRVISLLTGRFNHHQSTEARLRKICHMLVRIHSVVEEAKGRRITNPGVLQWLSELIDGEHQGRYLLDMIGGGSGGDRNELEDKEYSADKVLPLPRASSISPFNPAKRMRVAARSAMKRALSICDLCGADEIDRVLESLQGVSADLGEFIMLLQGYQPISRPLPTNIFVDGQMFGRHVEKERIINFLLHTDDRSSGELGVLPIVGAIGVGKTTLVQHACDDDRVRRHFSVIVFFNFSCTYAIATSGTTAAALRSKHVIGAADQLSLNDPLHWIKRNFHNQKFLIVFENVDMCQKQRLEELLLKLRCAAQGSRVIFTTNNRRVSTLGTVEPIILKVLPNPEYWFFFKAHAFAGRDLEENPRLVTAGEAIARKLNGSFYGAKIVGRLLKDHPDPRFWCKPSSKGTESRDMRFRRGKSSNKAKKGSTTPWQNGERKVDGGTGSNSRQVAPDTGFGGYGSSIDETFFEANPWLESDCEDDFYSVNGDLTPARSLSSQTSRVPPSPANKNLPTLGAILKAEPLKPPTQNMRKLGDLLREPQDEGDLSRADSLRLAEEANRCCVPQFARAISCNGRRNSLQK